MTDPTAPPPWTMSDMPAVLTYTYTPPDLWEPRYQRVDAAIAGCICVKERSHKRRLIPRIWLVPVPRWTTSDLRVRIRFSAILVLKAAD